MKITRGVKCFLDGLLLIFTALFSYLFWRARIEEHKRLVFFFMGLQAAAAFYCLIRDLRHGRSVKKPVKADRRRIYELALLNEQDDVLRTWTIQGMPSAVIGKSTPYIHADIDLRETAFAALVDPEHALLNYTETGWYIEDNDSHNGISIEKPDGHKYRISKTEPCKIEKGDILHIANTRLQVR